MVTITNQYGRYKNKNMQIINGMRPNILKIRRKFNSTHERTTKLDHLH